MDGKRLVSGLDTRRLSLARQQYHSCHLCQHHCGINRSQGEMGFCKAGDVPRLVRHRIEYSEEIDLIPSHLFYLSGCDLRCAFCIAGLNAFDPGRGRELSGDLFNQAVDWGIEQGARNIQWVGGEPTIHLPALLELMAQCPNLPPVVWKSDFHFTKEALDLLEGVVDVYVADHKFGNAQCAARLGGGAEYVERIQENLILAAGGARLIVRHLLLPGHLECCFRPIARWLGENLPETEISLRLGYLPNWRSNRFEEISHPLGRAEAQAATELAASYGLRMIQ
jgi:putative pyruvate formate lyase activating enzyme